MILNEISLARLCERSYRQAYESYDEYGEFDAAIPVISGGAEAMVLIKNKTMIIVVRGTEIDQPNDLITISKSLFTVKHRLGQVHRGFAQYYQQLLTGVLTLYLIHKPDRIVCAGHSLGGAIATLLAGTMRTQTPDVTLFTIGAPRVGRKNFAKNMIVAIGEKCYQYQIDTDVVIHLPPKFWPFRFAHMTSGYTLDIGAGAVRTGIMAFAIGILRRAIGLPDSIDRPLRTLLAKMGMGFISDHSCKSYIKGLTNLVEQRSQEGRGPMISIEL